MRVSAFIEALEGLPGIRVVAEKPFVSDGTWLIDAHDRRIWLEIEASTKSENITITEDWKFDEEENRWMIVDKPTKTIAPSMDEALVIVKKHFRL